MLKCFSCSIVAGVFLITAGILCVTLVPWLVDEGVRASVKMETPTCSLYDSFKNSSAKGVEVYKSIYLFHIVNAWAVQDHGAVPHLEKLGPFTYREFETYNESVTAWHPDGTFTYRSFTTYVFQPDLTTGDLDRVITIPRGSYFSVIKLLKVIENDINALLPLIGNSTIDEVIKGLLPPLLPTLLNDLFIDKVGLLQNTSVFVNATVRQIITDGYPDPLLTEFQNVLEKLVANKTPSNVTARIALLTNTTPEEYDNPALNNIAYTGGQASSTQPPIPDHAYRKLTQWHGSPTVSYWGTDDANQVAGTDATAFHPFIKKGERLLVWVNALVRKVWLTFEKEVSVKGVNCYRHVIDPAELENSPSNSQAYYMNTNGWLPAPPLELTRPVNYTKALFLDAQTEGICNFTGLEQDMAASRDELDTYLDIEPMTGALFQVHKRLQGNVQLAPMTWNVWSTCGIFKIPCDENQTWAPTKNLPTTMIPLSYLDQHMVMPDSIVKDLKDLIFIPLLVAKVMGGIGISVGCVVVIASAVVLCLKLRRERRDYQQHEFYQFVNDDGKV